MWSYIQENGVPYNALHDRGYPSIGCAPCTRAVKPYEDERAGRWWWESADKKRVRPARARLIGWRHESWPRPAPLSTIPVCLRLHGKRVLLIGAGTIAEGRALAAARDGRAGADDRAPGHRHAAEPRRAGTAGAAGAPLRPGRSPGFALVFVATDDRRVSEAVAAEARALGIWLNAADEPDLCDFTIPSIGRRGAITVAVSTAGQSPALARHLRQTAHRAASRSTTCSWPASAGGSASGCPEGLGAAGC